MTKDDVNVYINFALYAVLGKLAEADDLIVRHGDSVRRAAAWLMQRKRFGARPLYRGMLIDGELRADARYKFISWSEDRDVASWFASKESAISDYVLAHRPTVRGVVLTLPRPERVLFHYSWAQGWERLAVLHPHMGPEGARQIAWSLRTQREVITEPLEILPPAVDADAIEHPPIAELDRRLAPPWIGGASW